MVVNTIYIARHGYRSNWLPEGPYPDPLTGIDSDVPLAEHGVQQAKELAHYLLSLDNQPEAAFASPFYRPALIKDEVQTISVSFTVKSSSLDAGESCIITEGLIQTGGAGKYLHM